MEQAQAWLTGLAVAGAALSIIAHWADRRRLRRATPDGVGFMPWPTVAMAGIAIALLSAVFAMMAGGS